MQRPVAVLGCFSEPCRGAERSALPWLTWISSGCCRVDTTGLTDCGGTAPDVCGEGGAADILTVTNRYEGVQAGESAHSLFHNLETQSLFLEKLHNELAAGPWQGVYLDLRVPLPWEREPFNRFLRTVAEQLHGEGCLLFSALPPKEGEEQRRPVAAAHDFALHGSVADYCVLAAGQWADPWGPPAAGTPLEELRRALDYTVSVIPPERVLLEIPGRARDWSLPFHPGAVAQSLPSVTAVTIAGATGAEIRYSRTARCPFFRYADGEGGAHEVWFEDARSLAEKCRLVRDYGLAGICLEHLEDRDRTCLRVMERMFRILKLC